MRFFSSERNIFRGFEQGDTSLTDNLLSTDNKNRVLMDFVVYGQRKVRLDCFLDRQVDALNSFCEFLHRKDTDFLNLQAKNVLFFRFGTIIFGKMSSKMLRNTTGQASI